jgi:hypothetical protein
MACETPELNLKEIHKEVADVKKEDTLQKKFLIEN